MKNIFQFICSIICLVSPFTHANASTSSANSATTENEISTWDFYTKYLANAKTFKGSKIVNDSRFRDYKDGVYGYQHICYQMKKERWEISPTDSHHGRWFEINGNIEYAETENKSRFDSRMDVKSLKNIDDYVSGYWLGAQFSVPILTSEGKIVVYHDPDYSYCYIHAGRFGSMSNINYDSPTWQIENATNTIRLNKSVGDYFEFSCEFNPINFEYKEPTTYCSLFTGQYLYPSFNEIELTIDPKQLNVYDEFGEWQWNEQRDTLWVTSKGKGILNTCPIRLTIAVTSQPQHVAMHAINKVEYGDSTAYDTRDNAVKKRYKFLLTLESDCFEFCHEKMTAESGEKIYDINFNFGNGNIPLTFVGNSGSTENKCITFGAFNRFKNTFNYEANEILNQMKANNYCVVTLKDKKGIIQSYVFRLEGLESLLYNFE